MTYEQAIRQAILETVAHFGIPFVRALSMFPSSPYWKGKK